MPGRLVWSRARTWKFAEILAQATDVFGSQAEAEAWMERPAIGLGQHRPIDLLTTPAGAALVEDFLRRLEFGVYTSDRRLIVTPLPPLLGGADLVVWRLDVTGHAAAWDSGEGAYLSGGRWNSRSVRVV